MRKTILILFLCSGLCFGDTLIMRDGSRHDGVLETTTEQYVTFNEGGMRHRYTRSDVQSVQFNSNGAANTSYNGSRDNTYNGSPNNTYGNNGQYSNNGTYNNNTSGNNGTYNNGNNGSYNNANNGTNNYPDRDRDRNYAGGRNGGNSLNVPAGTEIAVRTDQTIDSQSANEGQLFPAEVQQDVVDSAGNVVIPRGSQAELTIRSVNAGNGATGSNDLALGLDSVNVGGNTYRVSTQDVAQQGNSGLGKNKRTGEYVGGGAVLGTLIGAIAGGGKGAAIGAVTGAAAGAGAQVLTRGKSVKVPAETVLRFRLDDAMQLQR
jgi:hypothetical protein